MAKRANGVMEFELAKSVLTYTFSPTQIVTYDATANFPTFPEMNDCQQRIIINGLKQRLQDGVGGAGRTITQRFERMSEIADNLRRNVYSARGESVPTDLKFYARVVAAVQGKPHAEATILEAIRKWSDAQITAYMAKPQFVAEIERQRAAIVASVNVADLDAQLDAIGDKS